MAAAQLFIGPGWMPPWLFRQGPSRGPGRLELKPNCTSTVVNTAKLSKRLDREASTQRRCP